MFNYKKLIILSSILLSCLTFTLGQDNLIITRVKGDLQVVGEK